VKKIKMKDDFFSIFLEEKATDWVANRIKYTRYRVEKWQMQKKVALL